jgi:hypothetical protein
LSPFDCDCQCCSFPIQRNRDKNFYAQVRHRSFHTAWTRSGPLGVVRSLRAAP